MTLTPAEQAQVDAARARWRAELLDYDAAALESIGHSDDAFRKQTEAEVHRVVAETTERCDKVIASADRSTPEGRAARTAAMLELREMRAWWRGINEYLGRPSVVTVDNFPEPSAAELLGGN